MIGVTPADRQSVLARLAPTLISLTGSKRMFASADRTMEHAAEHLLRPQPYAPPRSLDRRVRLSVRTEDGWPVYTVSPEFTVPIYPLVPRPEATALNVVSRIADIAAELVAERGGENVVLLGDSAGGTIALSVAQLLRDRGVPAPRDIVLISPVIDMRFTDPEIYRIEPWDPWLDVPGPRAAGERWRGGLDITDPLVSPAFGALTGIGHLSLFTGTRDITHADAITLEAKAAREDHSLTVHRADGMIHVYPLLPFREGEAAREAIRRVLRGDRPTA